MIFDIRCQCHVLAQWIEGGRHFGGLVGPDTLQGKGNIEKLNSGAAWHADAENSPLHSAATPRGQSRVLRSKLAQTDSNSTQLRPQNSPNEAGGQRMTEAPERQGTQGGAHLSSDAPRTRKFFDADYERSSEITVRYTPNRCARRHGGDVERPRRVIARRRVAGGGPIGIAQSLRAGRTSSGAGIVS